MPSAPVLRTVDLHSHPFMADGMGVLFRGRFDGPLRARRWDALFRSQINEQTLLASGNQIVVASLYAHPVLNAGGTRNAIRRQIDAAERFVGAHHDWVLGRDAAQARAAVDAGKRVLVLALERAAMVLWEEEDIVEFVDERGIRIVTFLHLIDDSNGGAALMGGVKNLLSPWARLRSTMRGCTDEGGVPVNRSGLTPKGLSRLRMLLDHDVWMDWTHASDASLRDALPLLRERGQPLLFTHTTLRAFSGMERGISDEQLGWVQESGGLVGLLPARDMLAGTAVDPRYCPPGEGQAGRGGLPSFATQYGLSVARLGAHAVALGSDFNGGIAHLPPASGTLTSLDGASGFWNIGQTPELWSALHTLGAPLPTGRVMVDGFLDAWAKVKGGRRAGGPRAR